MLVFIDESYHDKDVPHPKSTFSAMLIQERKYREFDTKPFELKRHFWKVDNPYDMELKGRLLLNDRALTLPKTRDFVEQFIVLCKEVGAVFFAVVQEGTFTLASESDKLPSLYRHLLRRVNTYMEDKHQEDQAVFFFDGIDHRTNQKIAISFNNFMYRHHWGQSSKNILPTPFFCDSEVSPGIQMADVMAYCVNQRYGGRRGRLEEIFQKFRELSYNHLDPEGDFTLWGVTMVKPEPSALLTPMRSMTTVTTSREEVEILQEGMLEVVERESLEVKTETGGPEGPATPPVR